MAPTTAPLPTSPRRLHPTPSPAPLAAPRAPAPRRCPQRAEPARARRCLGGALDDDDLLLQRALYHYGTAIAAHPGRPWLVADFLRVDEHGCAICPARIITPGNSTPPVAMLTAIFRAEHFIQGNVCYTRQLLDEVGGYDAGLAMAEDLDLYVRFLLAGHLPVVCAHYSHLHRFHAANTSQNVDAARHNADLRVIYDKYASQARRAGRGRAGHVGR
ncbi:MAG: hypothetical protein WKG07_13765 [Hymenobacter sp.]